MITVQQSSADCCSFSIPFCSCVNFHMVFISFYRCRCRRFYLYYTRDYSIWIAQRRHVANEEARLFVHTLVCQMTIYIRADSFSTTHTRSFIHGLWWLLNIYKCMQKSQAKGRPKEKETRKKGKWYRKMESSRKKNVEWIYYFVRVCGVLCVCVFVALLSVWSIDSRRRAIIQREPPRS